MPGPQSDMPISELTERDTQAIEASVISSAPLVVETEDRVTHETWPTPTESHRAWGLEPPDPKSGVQLTEVRRPAREGPEVTSRRIEPGEKTQMSPYGLISTFSFDPSLYTSP